MSTATPTPRPTASLMSFPATSGTTVEVLAVDGSSAPYRWTCSAGHGGHAYASLPFCRDDAKAHAAECTGVINPVIAEQHRIEQLVAGLHTGESAVINGTEVTAISLAVAEALTVYKSAAVHAAELATAAGASGADLPALDVRSWEFAEELMAGSRATLAAAGMLHLIEVAA